MHRTMTLLLLTLAVSLHGTARPAERQPWTTSRVHGTPEPPLRFTTERIFPSISFTEPVDMAYLPGTRWLYVMELTGKIYAFDGAQEDPERKLVFDIRSLLDKHNHSYGLTFHPRVAENRYVYVSWTLPGELVEDGTHVSRFELSDDTPPQIRPETRTDIIKWPSGGHNGASLKFGPEGYLYVSAGDGVGPFPPDSEETGQDISDLRSTIMRIDVDTHAADREYSVPADNPFLDIATARPEVWAYGFRNPWKMNFSPTTGELFVGDVGWELWELVYRVEKGGNYGWSVMEGRQPVRADVQRGPTPILPPIADHHHIEARSVTGGYVYRGEELPFLRGAYLYGDYVTGKIWGLRNDANRVTWQEELADTPLAIITFGENEQGDLFIVDYGGGIYRLKPNPQFGRESDFPRRLSETGLFADVAAGRPADGVLPYAIIAEPWMEGATAERFVALPGTSSIKTVRDREQWTCPTDTVFVKTISLPARTTSASGGRQSPVARNLETQILHFNGEQWNPYTYVWNDEQTDAVLAPAQGAHSTVVIAGEEWTWRFHSRAECNTCHTPRGGFTLGFYPQNLATSAADGSDQLTHLIEADVFEAPFSDRDRKATVVDPRNESAGVDARARSYLMANCAHCHRRGGGGTAFIEFEFDLSLDKTNSIDAPPTQGNFNIPHARIIAPGDPFRSVLYYRMATVGRGHMPHLGARRVDDAGLELIHDWIAGLTPAADSEGFADRNGRRQDTLIAELTSRSSGNGGSTPPAISGDLLQSTTVSLELAHRIADGHVPRPQANAIIATGARHEDPIIRGLFERFLAESARTQRLGTSIDATQILALEGDPARGRELFTVAAGVQCRNCHQIGNAGREVGPKLDDVGKRLTREQLLESILDPSRKIDAPWVGHTLITADGRVLTGLIRERTAQNVVLRDSQGNDHRIATADIDELVPQQKSVMPELLVQDLTATQLADLLAFLASLSE